MRNWIERNGWSAGAVGGLLATLGDFGELWVGNASQPGLHLAAAPGWILLPAVLIGVCGMFLYIAGYAACALRVERMGHQRSADALIVAGVFFGGMAAVVHGATGVVISLASGTSAPAGDALAGILAAGPVYVSLWGLAFVPFLMANGILLKIYTTLGQRLLTPLPLMLAFTLGAILLPLPWRDFIAPAAVNIAHLIFFSTLLVRPSA